MSIYQSARYKDQGAFSFPSSDVDPKIKDGAKYCREYAESIYSTHIRNRAGISFDELYLWEDQRRYGKGLQDKHQYKAITITEDLNSDPTFVDANGVTKNSLEERRKGWKNINDDIVSIAPKIKDVFHGLFDNQDFQVDADTIDLNSGATKDRAKYGLLAQTMFAKEFARLRALGGIPQQQQEFVPRNLTELDMYEVAGGFKLNVAKSMEKLIRHTFEISDWDNVLKKKLIDDVVDIGYIAVREVYDPDTHKSKLKYADPASLTVQYSREDDYEDADWCGYYTTYTISQLEQIGFTRAQLEQLSYDYSSTLGNPSKEIWEENQRNKPTLGGYHNDYYRIPVYEVEWIDSNTTKYLEWNNKQGKTRMKEVPYETEDKNLTVKTMKYSKARVVYKCKWIIGTKHVWDYGIANDQIRPTPSKPVLSYRVVKVTENPIMKRLKPILDKMQLAWLRYQNALIMSAGGGWAINLRLLSNLEMGGQKLKVGDVLRMMRNNNVLFFSDTPVNGRYEGGSVNPVTPLPSMLGDEIASAIQEFEYSIKQVEHITGLTPVALGGTPEERAGKATTELSFAATQNVIRPIISNIMTLKERAAESAMLHIQMLIRNNKKSAESYADVVGEMDVATIKSATYEGTRYGIKLRAKPTEQEWADIYALIQEALALGRDGVKSIDLDDALYMYEMKDSGMNMSEMRMTLSYKIRKHKEEAQQQVLQTQQLQQQGASQLEQQKTQKEFALQDKEVKGDMAKSNLEHQNKMKEEKFKANQEFKMKVMELASEEKIAEDNLKAQREQVKTTA
jgi:hypothetical protein